MPEYSLYRADPTLVGECKQCNKPFPRTKGTRQYCSIRCRKRAERENLKKRDQRERGQDQYQQIQMVENPTLAQLQAYILLARTSALPGDGFVHFCGALPEGFVPPGNFDVIGWAHHPEGEIPGAPEYWTLGQALT